MPTDKRKHGQLLSKINLSQKKTLTGGVEKRIAPQAPVDFRPRRKKKAPKPKAKDGGLSGFLPSMHSRREKGGLLKEKKVRILSIPTYSIFRRGK